MEIIQESPFIDYLEKLKPEEGYYKNYYTFSFKWNIRPTDDIKKQKANIIAYMLSHIPLSASPIFYSIGEHREGKSKNPHIHLHIATKVWDHTSNESRRRTAWLTKHDEDSHYTNLTCRGPTKVADLLSLENHLKYPMKENKELFSKNPRLHQFPNEITKYLLESAVAQFQVKITNDLREAKKLQKNASILCKLNYLTEMEMEKRNFNNYQEFKEFIYEAYFEGMEIDEYPTIKHLHEAVQKVAIKNGIVRPWYFDRD